MTATGYGVTFTGSKEGKEMNEWDGKDLALKKHVNSIHCSNTLSLLQRKISNVLLYHAYGELLEKDEHTISIKTLCGLIGYSSHDYDSIKRALKALISTVIEWNILGDSQEGVEDWHASSMLASVGIKGGQCTYAYSTRLKKLLYMPEIYGRINLAVQARFKSNYALALYENCIRYQNLPHTRWFELSTFRVLMGVPTTQYIIFRDFKRRVVDKSVAEVNAFSDISVEAEIERKGHAVSRIRFKLKSRTKAELGSTVSENVSDKNIALSTILCKRFGFSHTQSKQVLDKFDETIIRDKIKMVEDSPAHRHNKIQNKAAYLFSMMMGKESATKPTTSTIKATSHTVKRDKELLLKQYAESVSNVVDQAYETFNLTTKTSLCRDFETFLQESNNFFVLDKYSQKGLNNRIVKSIFRTFLRQEFPHLLPEIDSFEQFTAKH